MRHRRGLCVHVCVCMAFVGPWKRGGGPCFFLGVLFVCKWCALELGICKGMQDCLCQCDMLKHTLFIQRCRTVAGWRDTYRGGVPYRQCLSPANMILYLKLHLTVYIGIHFEKVSATDLTHENPLKIFNQEKIYKQIVSSTHTHTNTLFSRGKKVNISHILFNQQHVISDI